MAKEKDVKSSQIGVKEGYERFSTITTMLVVQDIKQIAYWDRLLVKDVVTKALSKYIEDWKAENPALVEDGRVKGN